MTIESPSAKKTALEFKSTSLTTPALVLLSPDLDSIDQQLAEKVSQAPEFFKNSPLLIDLQKLNAKEINIQVDAVVALVRQHGFMPIGIRGGNEQQNQQALAINLPIHSIHGQNVPLVEKQATKAVVAEVKPAVEANQSVENKLITQPIRSGQRVYAKGDLIVTATVSAGAEIMAEGNIHVYGSLRGRALAGVLGNTESRIFCSDLQAELVSVAGIYKSKDDLAGYSSQTPVHISLKDQTLDIKNI
jgi:septum site-determining protein MinC